MPAVVGQPRLPTSDVRPDNGYVVLFESAALRPSGAGVTIEGREFTFSGASGGGHAAGTAEAYAFNLATAVTAAAGLVGVQIGPRRAGFAGCRPLRRPALRARRARSAWETSVFTITERFSSTSSEVATRHDAQPHHRRRRLD